MDIPGSKMDKFLVSYHEYPAKSVHGQARGIISDSATSEKLAGFFIRNLVKLANLGRDSPIFQQFFYLFSIFFLNRF
jgi:hypothetical protein